jgi:hypothetical protein
MAARSAALTNGTKAVWQWRGGQITSLASSTGFAGAPVQKCRLRVQSTFGALVPLRAITMQDKRQEREREMVDREDGKGPLRCRSDSTAWSGSNFMSQFKMHRQAQEGPCRSQPFSPRCAALVRGVFGHQRSQLASSLMAEGLAETMCPSRALLATTDYAP